MHRIIKWNGLYQIAQIGIASLATRALIMPQRDFLMSHGTLALQCSAGFRFHSGDCRRPLCQPRLCRFHSRRPEGVLLSPSKCDRFHSGPGRCCIRCGSCLTPEPASRPPGSAERGQPAEPGPSCLHSWQAGCALWSLPG